MKSILSIVAMLLVSLSNAQDATPNQFVKLDNAINAQTIKSIESHNGIEVDLTNSTINTISFSGAHQDVLQVRWTIKKGVLKLYSLNKSLKGKVKVLVNLPSLSSIDLYDDGIINTSAPLSQDVNLNIHHNGKAHLKSTAKIKVNTMIDNEVEEFWIKHKK